MITTTRDTADTASKRHEARRTVVAVVSASVISLLIWGLVVVLQVH